MKRRSAWGAVDRLIRKDVIPLWGHRQIASITRRDVLDVIDGVADRGAPITARRLHAHVHRLFKWAVGRGIIESNPASDLPKPGAEVARDRVLTWNPTRKSDAIDVFLRQKKPANAIVVEANWKHNPFFPPVLNEERLLYRRTDPGAYDHVWEGGYATAVSGSYFGDLLAQARREGRVCEIHIDPLLEVRAFFDIGVADATSIWLAQFSGAAIHVIDYIEGSAQPLAYYVNELRWRGYEQARCILPHDGVNKSVITGKRYEEHLQDAGFRTEVIHNQGTGAARMRIEAVRRMLPRCHFDEKRCEAGLEALAWYHERLDDHREVGLGPLHDWSSHAADAFGLLAVSYTEPSQSANFNRKIDYQTVGVV